MQSWRMLSLVPVLLVLFLAGCGPKRETGRVFGLVSFEGKPLVEGTMLFSNSAQGVHLTAKIETDGHYVLKTFDEDGLPLGDYVVSVLPPPVDLVTGAPTPPIKEFPNIPARYRDPATSGLKITVARGDNPFDVDMKP